MRKSIQEYDRIKKTMYNNKRVNNSSFVLPPANPNKNPSQSLKNSKVKD